jgi:signal peptidase I
MALLLLFIRTFIVQAFKIPSGSMIPTLQIGDHILVNKLDMDTCPLWGHYLVDFGKVQRGDVIVFIFPEDRSKDFIKRVVGVAGDAVEIRGKKISSTASRRTMLARILRVMTRRIFYAQSGRLRSHEGAGKPSLVMGDNRDRSYDSRFWGFVNLDDVRGKAFLIYWSWDGGDRWVRWAACQLGSLAYVHGAGLSRCEKRLMVIKERFY